jgi:hypothetical protein
LGWVFCYIVEHFCVSWFSGCIIHPIQYFTSMRLLSGVGQWCCPLVVIMLASGAGSGAARWFCSARSHTQHTHKHTHIPTTIIPISIIIIIIIIIKSLISIIIIIVIVAIIFIINLISIVITDVFVTCCQGSWPMLPASGADQWWWPVLLASGADSAGQWCWPTITITIIIFIVC